MASHKRRSSDPAIPCRKKRRKLEGAGESDAAATDDDTAEDEPAGTAIAAGIVRQTTRSGEIAVHIHPCCSHHMLDFEPCCTSVSHPADLSFRVSGSRVKYLGF